MKLIDLTGSKFGKLTVQSRASDKAYKRPHWVCICDCGGKSVVSGTNLNRLTTRSCGCLYEVSKRATTHGLTKSRAYGSWCAMKYRCLSEKHESYARYGGRGITICDRWLRSFEAFYEDMGERPEGLTLERIDNDKGYYKENCKWATRSEQNKNQYHPPKPGLGQKISFKGKDLTVAQWAEALGLSKITIHKRLRAGWAIKDVLSTTHLRANQHFRSNEWRG